MVMVGFVHREYLGAPEPDDRMDPYQSSRHNKYRKLGKPQYLAVVLGSERWGMVPDPQKLSTGIRGGNFDYLTEQVAWTSSSPSQMPPASPLTERQARLFRQISIGRG